MNKKYMDFVPSKPVEKSAGRAVSKKPVEKKYCDSILYSILTIELDKASIISSGIIPGSAPTTVL